jgi:hypothetical protein
MVLPRVRLGSPLHAGAFAVIALLFLLPFFETSCADQESVDRLGEAFALGSEPLRGSIAGWELVSGRHELIPQGLEDQDFVDAEKFHVPAEPFAQIAFGATVVGLVFCFNRNSRTRDLATAISATVVAGSLWLLHSSATLRMFGLVRPSPQPALWAALLIAIGISLWSWRTWYLAKEQEAFPVVDRSPPPRRPPMPPP